MLKPILMCSLAGVFYCYEYLLRIAPNVMLNDLMSEFNMTAGAVGNLAAFFYYAYTPLQLPAGFLLDYFGLKRMLTLATFCCALGAVLFSTTSFLGVAQFGRFLIGFGSAFALLGVLKLAAVWFSSAHFAMITGLVIAIGTLGAMLGNVVMSWLNQEADWRTLHYGLAIIGFCLTPLMWLYIEDVPIKTKTLSYWQLWRDLMQIIKNRMLWINALIGCLLFLPTNIFNELWGHSFLLSQGISNTSAASAIAMTFLGWAIGSPLAGILSQKWDRKKILLQIACVSTFLLFLIVLYFPSLSLSALYVVLFLLGLLASPQILVFAIAKEKCKPEFFGTVFAFNNFVIMMGGLICQPLIGKVLDICVMNYNQKIVPIYSHSSYVLALSLIPLGLLMAFCLTALLKEK